MGCFYSKSYDEEDSAYDMTPIRHLPVIFVNGVPGAGNQTVASTIANITGYTMIRPGEIVRAEAEKDTARGRLIADKLQAQEEIPEQITVDLIKEAMLSQQDAKGYILVGFPRNPTMSNLFNRQVKWPEKIVALEVNNELAATRLQNKLSELGRPESEINAARQIVREAAQKVKIVHKRFGGHVITLDSSGNPKALATTLRDILADTIGKDKDNANQKMLTSSLNDIMEKNKRPESPELRPPHAESSPSCDPSVPTGDPTSPICDLPSSICDPSAPPAPTTCAPIEPCPVIPQTPVLSEGPQDKAAD